jgi:hypothetical protein
MNAELNSHLKDYIIEIVNNGAIFNYEGKPITNRTFNKNRDYLWPIPFTQIQENPQLIQNPGYN